MTAKLGASTDGTKVTLGTSAEDILQIDTTAKTIKPLGSYKMAGNGPAFIARKTASQTIVSGEITKVTMGVEDYDTDNCFDLANSRFTPNVAGFYYVSGLIYSIPASGAAYAHIFKNGADYLYGTGAPQGVSGVSGLVYMNGTTDYLELWVGVANTTITGIETLTHFSAFLARTA
jgi:hypothetical protein